MDIDTKIIEVKYSDDNISKEKIRTAVNNAIIGRKSRLVSN